MVVVRYRQHATKAGGAGRVGVLEHIAGAVNARALAVPQAEYTIVLGAFENIDLLGTPDRGSTQVLIDARQKMDVLFFQVVAGFPQHLVETAQGRAAVAGNKAGGIEAVGAIKLE